MDGVLEKGRGFGKRAGFFKMDGVSIEKDGVLEKGRGFENPGFWQKDGFFF